MKKVGQTWKALSKEEQESYASSPQDDINLPSSSPSDTGPESRATLVMTEEPSSGREQSQSLAQSRIQVDRWMDNWQRDVIRLDLHQPYANAFH